MRYLLTLFLFLTACQTPDWTNSSLSDSSAPSAVSDSRRAIQDREVNLNVFLYTESYIRNALEEAGERNHEPKEKIESSIQEVVNARTSGRTCFLISLRSTEKFEWALFKNWVFKIEASGMFSDLKPVDSRARPKPSYDAGTLSFSNDLEFCTQKRIERPFTVRAIPQFGFGYKEMVLSW